MANKYYRKMEDGTVCRTGPGCKLHGLKSANGDLGQLRQEFDRHVRDLRARTALPIIEPTQYRLSVGVAVERIPEDSVIFIGKTTDGKDVLSWDREETDGITDGYTFLFAQDEPGTRVPEVIVPGKTLAEARAALVTLNGQDIALLPSLADHPRTAEATRRLIVWRFNAIDAIDSGASDAEYTRVQAGVDHLDNQWNTGEDAFQSMQEILQVAAEVERSYPDNPPFLKAERIAVTLIDRFGYTDHDDQEYANEMTQDIWNAYRLARGLPKEELDFTSEHAQAVARNRFKDGRTLARRPADA